MLFDEKARYDVQVITGGASGNTGIITIDKKKYFYKISKRVDFTLEHEYKVMKCIYKYYMNTNHIVKPFSLETVTNCLPYKYINTLSRKYLFTDSYMKDPFNCNKLKSYDTKVLFTEYIEGACTLEEFIQDTQVSDDEIISCILQTFCLLTYLGDIYYNHYDLHTGNILITKGENNIRRYIIEDESLESLDVPSYGNIIKLIDQGLARTCKDDYQKITYRTNGMRELHLARVHDDILDYYYLLNRVSSSLKKSHRKDLYDKLNAYNNRLFGDTFIHMKPKDFPTYIEEILDLMSSDSDTCLLRKYFKDICILTLSLSNTNLTEDIDSLDIDLILHDVSSLVDKIYAKSNNNMQMLLDYKHMLMDDDVPECLLYFSKVIHYYMERNFKQVYSYIEAFKEDNFIVFSGEELTISFASDFPLRAAPGSHPETVNRRIDPIYRKGY